MATILAHITVRPGTEADFEALARTLYEGTHATESAVRHYEYWRGSEPRTYYTLLSFDDHRGFIHPLQILRGKPARYTAGHAV